MSFCHCCGKPIPASAADMCPTCYPLYRSQHWTELPPIMREAGLISFDEWAQFHNLRKGLIEAGETDEVVKARLMQYAEKRAKMYGRRPPSAEEQQRRREHERTVEARLAQPIEW